MDMIAAAKRLGDDLTALKALLAKSGHGDLVRTIEDAMLAGSTSLEIHYRLLGVLRQIRPGLVGNDDIIRLIDQMTSLIEGIVYSNS